MIKTPTASPLMPFAVACLGVLVFSCMDALMKSLSIALGAYNALLWRSLVGTVLGAPLFLIQVGRMPQKRTMWLHLGRSVAGACSVLLFFWGLVRVPLAQGLALSFVAPFLALGLAALFLKEKIGKRAIGGSMAAFAGVLVILAGQSGADGKGGTMEGAVAILIGSMLYAVSLVIGRRQSMAARPIEVAFAFGLIASVLFLLMAPLSIGAAQLFTPLFGSMAGMMVVIPVLPDIAHWPMILLAAIVGTTAIMLLAWAYARAEAQQLVAVEYTAFVWAALLGWFVFGEHVLPTTAFGAAMIIAGCLWAARQKAGRPHPVIEPEAAE